MKTDSLTLDSSLSRRSMLRRLGGACATAALAACVPGAAAGAARQLDVYSWPNYFSPGDLRAYFDGSNTIIQADVNGDKGVDFHIQVMGSISFSIADFVL